VFVWSRSPFASGEETRRLSDSLAAARCELFDDRGTVLLEILSKGIQEIFAVPVAGVGGLVARRANITHPERGAAPSVRKRTDSNLAFA
jgi:hypothetical protein